LTRRKDDERNGFNAETFLATAGVGRTLLNLKNSDASAAPTAAASSDFTLVVLPDTQYYVHMANVSP
jgi:hypothetical protein